MTNTLQFDLFPEEPSGRPPRSGFRLQSQVQLTPSRREILELLCRYRYMSASLLGLAYAHGAGRGRGLSHVRHELSRLYQAGLVQRFYPGLRPRGLGSDEYIYVAAKPGARAVLAPDDYRRQQAQIYNRAQRKANYPHLLAITTLQLILELGQQSWTVEEFRADHEDPKGGSFRVKVLGKTLTVWPDASAVFGFGNDQRTLYLFELDRERKNNQRIHDRFLAYASHLTENLDLVKRENAVNNAVAVFVAPTERERDTLRVRAAGILGAWSRRSRPQFLFWSMSDWHRAGHRRIGSVNAKSILPTLSLPEEILAATTVVSVEGKARRLVQS